MSPQRNNSITKPDATEIIEDETLCNAQIRKYHMMHSRGKRIIDYAGNKRFY